MRSRFFALFGIVSLALAGCTRAPVAPAKAASQAASCEAAGFNAAAVERHAGPATLLVSTNEGYGSGFLIRDGREELIVTNFHVVAAGVQHAGLWTLADGTQRHVALEVVSIDRDQDLALLKPQTPVQAEALLLSSERPGIGDPVAVVGYPGVRGSNPVLTFEPGTITASQRQVSSFDFIQTNANINPGNSGGPLVDACGRVVGVVVAKHKTTERLGLVIPTQSVKKLLDRYHQPRQTPEQAAEKQLQAFFTEVKFRRSDRAAQYFTRRFVEKNVVELLTGLYQQANQKLDALRADLLKRRKDPQKMPEAELQKMIDARLSGEEKWAYQVGKAVENKQQTSYAAAQQYLDANAADMFGTLDDVWVESTTSTQSGCIDAYVTASDSSGTRRYVVHLHNQWSEWLVDSIKQMR